MSTRFFSDRLKWNFNRHKNPVVAISTTETYFIEKEHFYRIMEEKGVMSDEKLEVRCPGNEWCAVKAAASIIGRKWHPVIVLELLKTERLGFNDLTRAVDGISNKVLSDALEDLEEKRIIDREIANEKPVRVEYSLTEFGESLGPVIDAMDDWGEQYLKAPEGMEVVSNPETGIR